MISGPHRRATSSCSSESTSTSMIVPDGGVGPRRGDGRDDRVGRSGPGRRPEPRQVVVLDQDGVVQAEAVVEPASAPHGVLLQRPPAGCRLSRIVDRRAAADDRRHVPRRQGRDPAETLEEVEGRPFHGQQRPHRPVQTCDHRPRLQAISIGLIRRPPSEQLELRGQPLDDRQTGQHAGRPRHQPSGTESVARYRRRRRDVPELAQVFRDRRREQVFEVAPLPLAEFVSRTTHKLRSTLRLDGVFAVEPLLIPEVRSPPQRAGRRTA